MTGGADPAGGYETLRYAVADGIATVTLHRPDRLNAFVDRMGDELMHVADRFDGDDDVRAVVFTGSGRAYCAGADLAGGGEIFERHGGDAGFDMERFADYGGTITRRFFDARKPLIAAVNGPAVGLGVTMTLPMDIRLAAESARFGFVFARRGLVPEACSSWFLPRLVGIAQAAEWTYSGRVFDAAEALRGGLVRSVHPDAELLPAAYRLAAELTEHSAPVAVALTRHMMWTMLGAASPAEAHLLDSRGIYHLGTSRDAKEGVAAFVEKREARFPLRVSGDVPAVFDDWS
ncbi:Enoyl-CoA hydratase [Jatrophihabitans endophyticus]|uniref:Enoyl-CoA hydratase n=1 Tax=Jatrophihabitans endophyticus TaxID=1206085 RepID=A0A1M5Q0C7_9ACTN|nr:crotonase/enoyl-CoA hydratase family protein [Jatrophihabitans endophyticus]SHH07717.1 Enoyl-CoA hydratase [Jatrophihabitans endophyticus]